MLFNLICHQLFITLYTIINILHAEKPICITFFWCYGGWERKTERPTGRGCVYVPSVAQLDRGRIKCRENQRVGENILQNNKPFKKLAK